MIKNMETIIISLLLIFGIGYNIMLAALSKGSTIDYSLVWDMPHGSNEGTSTGTFIDWVNSISK